MIYALWAKGTDFVKIGYTGNYKATKRLRDMQVGCPFELELLAFADGTKTDEAAFHAMLESVHVRGEWFKWGPKAKQVVAILKAMPEPTPYLKRRDSRNPHRRLGRALDLEVAK